MCSSCATDAIIHKYYEQKYSELSTRCIEKDEDMILELFDMYQSGTIAWIGQGDNPQADIVTECNQMKYSIGLPQDQKPTDETDKYQRACEIVDHLMSEYDIKEFTYYRDLDYLQIWFNGSTWDRDFGMTYYPPGIEHPKDIPDKERSEEIRDGFYYYLYFKGF
jgi:hypothetical protein